MKVGEFAQRAELPMLEDAVRETGNVISTKMKGAEKKNSNHKVKSDKRKNHNESINSIIKKVITIIQNH